MSQQTPGQNLWRNAAISILLGVVAAVLFVLPAEYDVDPTGFGGLIGISGMSADINVSALSRSPSAAKSDSVEFVLAPFESVEYKYVLADRQAMVYSWQADSEVVFDFHSEAEGTDPEDAISFSIGRGAAEHGTYVAPYSGVHGWFWENRGTSEVTVRLITHGYYDASITYSPAGEYRREL